MKHENRPDSQALLFYSGAGAIAIKPLDKTQLSVTSGITFLIKIQNL